jgi:alpha-maltose-1-phosphate synthase
VYHGMTRIFAMSEYLRRSFIEDFDVPTERVAAVGAGINLEAIPDPVDDKQYDSREILFIGVDFPRKGGWELLRAFRSVRERLPDATLHIVGPHTLAIPAELEAGVVFHGYLSKQDAADRARLNDLFRRSCLFVMPSLYEPFGIAPLEAMANEIPCLVTDAWALQEMVTPGKTGALVACGSVDDLHEKLVALLRDPAQLRVMGRAGRQTVIERYTWSQVVDRLLHEIGNVPATVSACR